MSELGAGVDSMLPTFNIMRDIRVKKRPPSIANRIKDSYNVGEMFDCGW